jgi:DNA repair protein SbcC/Rad50
MAERALVELRAGESKALQAAAAEGDRAERARHALEQARAALAALRNAREQAAAALLARELRPGEPCPVCGSTEHPRPAAGDGEIPGEAALEAAERCKPRRAKRNGRRRTGHASRRSATRP